jgi:hypothetical protein
LLTFARISGDKGYPSGTFLNQHGREIPKINPACKWEHHRIKWQMFLKATGNPLSR